MPLHVAALVLLAAVLHATWNALLKSVEARLAMFALGSGVLGAGFVVAAPFAVPASDALPFVAASVAIHPGA